MSIHISNFFGVCFTYLCSGLFSYEDSLAHSFIDHVFMSLHHNPSLQIPNLFHSGNNFSTVFDSPYSLLFQTFWLGVTVKRSNQETTMRLHIAYLIWFFRYTKMLWQVKCLTWYLNLLQNTYMKQHLDQNLECVIIFLSPLYQFTWSIFNVRSGNFLMGNFFFLFCRSSLK